MVELRVVAEDPMLVERQAAVGCEIRGDARAIFHPLVERHSRGHLRDMLSIARGKA